MSYTITLIITSGSIFEGFRRWFTNKTNPFYQWITDNFSWITPLEGHKPHIYCRMCIGVLVSLIIATAFNVNFFIVYGASYFMATQER